ncbi:hypothetical protein TNCV_3231971 [Trichonephila clavipes]|nr:hypothetical protein TNCV_3231971 [Trichonephila clavipes]
MSKIGECRHTPNTSVKDREYCITISCAFGLSPTYVDNHRYAVVEIEKRGADKQAIGCFPPNPLFCSESVSFVSLMQAGLTCSHPRMTRALQAGFTRRSPAGVGFFESIRCHGPGLALLTNGGVQQQQQRAPCDCVYVPPLSADLPDLRHRVEAAVARITSDTLNKIWDELVCRLDVHRVGKGACIEHLTRAFTRFVGIPTDNEFETNMAVACQQCCHRFSINHFPWLDIKTFVRNRIGARVVDRVSRVREKFCFPPD